MKPTRLYDEATRRLEEVIRLREEVENDLNHAPAGKIRLSKCGNSYQLYLRNDPSQKSGKYIPKSQTNKIRTYLQKSYDERLLSILQNEISNLTALLNNSSNSVSSIRNLYSSYPLALKSFLTPADVSDEDFAVHWKSIPFEGKTIPDHKAAHKTLQGEYVRSKSELNIANELFQRGIPYKYECPLMLMDKSVIYPDFTVLDVHARKEKYWEHRGMMDDRDYARHTVQRMKLYQTNGYFPGEDLIITEETSTIVLGTKEIREVIYHYFA